MTTATIAPGTRRDVAEAAMARLLSRLQDFVPTAERRGDRGALAALRRAAGRRPGERSEADAIVFDSLPVEMNEREVDALFTVATLFAIHPVHGELRVVDRGVSREASRAERGFGASLRSVRLRESSNEEDQGVARRFAAALDAPREQVPVHLRHLITLLRSRNEQVPVDYRQLFRDLLDWDEPDRAVQRAWARGFWGGRGPSERDKDAAMGESANRDDQTDEETNKE